MDGNRFDDLTRILAGPTTRRGLMAGLAGLAAGLGGRQMGVAAARKQCPPDQIEHRRHGCVCRTSGVPPTKDGCPCRDRLTNCSGVCVNTNRDEGHCGACGGVCPTPKHGHAVCRQSKCQVVCDEGFRPDGLDCVPIQGCVDDGTACGKAVCGTAVNNCGETVTCGPLGGSCPANNACVSYVCQDGACLASGQICINKSPCAVATCDPERGCVVTPIPVNEQGGCAAGSVCCADGRCTPLGTAGNCAACGDICEAVDACTPAVCEAGMCNATSFCASDEACGADRQCVKTCAGLGASCSGAYQGTCCAGLICGNGRCRDGCAGRDDVCFPGQVCCDFPDDTEYCNGGGTPVTCPV